MTSNPQLFAVRLGEPLTEREWKVSLPVEDQIRIMKYRNWQDRQRALLGTVLVRSCLNEDFRIVRDESGRPFVDGNWGGDFNLSHSGEWIVTAITNTGRIGIDVEKIGQLHKDVMAYALTEAELKMDRNFYEVWTMKEAAYKTGLFPEATPQSLDVTQIKGVSMKQFYIDPDHPVTVCWNDGMPSDKITVLDRKELLLGR